VLESVTDSSGSNQWRALVEHALEGFVAIAPDWTITFVNPEAARINRCERDDLVGRSTWDVWPGIRGTIFEEVVRRVMATGVAERFEAAFAPMGAVFDCHIFRHGDGLGAFLRDRRPQRDAEARLAMLADGSPALIWHNGPDGGCEFVNRSYLEFFGRSIEEIRGFGWTPSLHPEDAEEYVATYRRAFAARDRFHRRARIQNAQGEYRWLDVDGRPRFSPDGEFQGYVGTCTDVTDLIEAEAALHRTEERFRIACEAVAGWVYDVDLRTGHVERTSGFSRLLGYSEQDQEPSVIWWRSLIHPEDLDDVLARAQAAFDSGKADVTTQYRLRDKWGTWRTLRDTCRIVRDAGGTPIRLVGGTADVTEQDRAERAVADRDQFITRVLATSPHMITVFSLETGAPTFIGGDTQALLGYSPDELMAMGDTGIARLMHPSDVERLPTFLRRWSTARDGEVLEAAYRMRGANGEWRRFLSRDTVFARDADGTPTHLLSTGIDVTAHYEAEEALRLSEARFRDLADAMPVVVWVTKAEGGIDFVNRWYMDYTGIEPGATSNEAWARVVHPDDRPEAFAHYARCIETGTAWEHELRLRRHDGSYRWHLSRSVPITNEAKEIVAWYGTSTDIHEHKELRDELERRVEARTADLSQAIEELEGFTYTVAHDLRTPLRAIVATSRLLEEDHRDRLDDDGQGLLKRQAKAARRLGDLIDDLLRLSRINRHEMQLEPLDLTTIVRELATEVAARTPESQVVFEVEEGLTAVGDERLIRLALQNLVENAVKFSPNGGAVRVGSKDGAFFVADQGIGFEMQYAHKLFRPFERLHRDDEIPGTGIGLANVDRAVRRHGGRVWAESTPGQGATFYFTIPGA